MPDPMRVPRCPACGSRSFTRELTQRQVITESIEETANGPSYTSTGIDPATGLPWQDVIAASPWECSEGHASTGFDVVPDWTLDDELTEMTNELEVKGA